MIYILFISLFLLVACAKTPVDPLSQSTQPPVTPGDIPSTLPTIEAPISPTLTKTSPEVTIFPTQDYIPTGEYEPQLSDGKLSRGNANLEYINFRQLESLPVQVALELQGYLPNGCHLLRVAAKTPDAENRIYIEVYSVYSMDMMCPDVIKPFEISLSLGSFPPGHYSIWVNGELKGEFEL